MKALYEPCIIQGDEDRPAGSRLPNPKGRRNMLRPLELCLACPAARYLRQNDAREVTILNLCVTAYQSMGCHNG